jgi:hypothetical protein
VIRTRESWPPKRDDLIAEARKARAEMNPPSDEQLRDEAPGSSKAAISPDAFDHLTGSPKGLGSLTRILAIAVLIAIGVGGGYLLFGSRSSGSSPAVSTQQPATPTGRSPGVTRPPTARPIGRLVVVSELPDNAWLEIDTKVYASGLGIDFPLRVPGDSLHQVSVHARDHESWYSQVYVPADSLVRIEVTLTRSRTTQVPSRPARQTQPREPEPQPVATPRRTDTRPPMPVALRDSLILRLEEGRVFHEIGRWFDSASEYRAVLDRLEQASGAYRSGSVITMLRARADSALQAVRLDCRAAGEDDCP